MLMTDAEDTRRTLRSLQERGVSIAIDDFGTGYSSLAYLRKLAAKTLKIDRSFVQRCAGRQEDEQIVRAIIGLAHDLDMQVVAEGVETIAQLSALQKLRCDSAQGYLIAQPLDTDELSSFILGHSVTVRHVTFPIKPPQL
jgi:EAL domain-containing protein (putative c-di-GMP-specific phosphodiesterase class I)